MKTQLAKNLKKALRDKDLTSAQLSRATKVPAQTINNWLAGLEPRSMGQVKTIANFLGTSLDALAYGDSALKDSNPLKQHEDEIFAGVFEVVLRRKETK